MTEVKANPTARASRGRVGVKIVLTGFVISAAVAGLLWASMGEGAEYYKHVDEAQSSQSHLQGKRLRVHGNVVEGSLAHQDGTLDYHFTLESKAPRDHATMAVDFHGIPPDLFKPGAEVIAAGVLDANGKLKSDRIETKCPSKYETQTGKP